MNVAILVLSFVTAERLAELWLARRNTARLMAAGATEHGAGHYPFMVAMHAAWLLGLWLLGRDHPVSPPWLLLFCLFQGLRLWVLATLGPRWTTRIIVLAGASLVRSGPYRYLAHPNYVVVVGEIAVLPLALGLAWYALLFSALNAVILFIRIKAENAALAPLRDPG